MQKATHAVERSEVTDLQQIINIGPSIAYDLQRIGIQRPAQLIDRDPVQLYRDLCEQDGETHDPCVIDCFMSAVDFMNGNPPQKWWKFTDQRKQLLAGKAK